MRTTGRINIRQTRGKAKDTKSLLAYSNYLIKKAHLTGNLCFDGHIPTDEEDRVAEECRILCGRISRYLTVCKMDEIPELLGYYDIAYRIGNGTPPDSTFITRQRERVFDIWKSGDREISDSTIFGIVTSLMSSNLGQSSSGVRSHQNGNTTLSVSSHFDKAEIDYMAVYQAMKEDWIATLSKYGRFPNETAYENYQRLSLIMRENLDEEFGYEADEMKYEWYEQNRVEDLSTLGSRLLKSYRRFVNSLFPHVLDYDEVAGLDSRILTELTTRPDLNHYDRQAFAMTLQYNKQLV